MAEIILDIKKLNKSFGPTHANVDIDFQLEAGEVRGLAGENGIWKIDTSFTDCRNVSL